MMVVVGDDCAHQNDGNKNSSVVLECHGMNVLQSAVTWVGSTCSAGAGSTHGFKKRDLGLLREGSLFRFAATHSIHAPPSKRSTNDSVGPMAISTVTENSTALLYQHQQPMTSNATNTLVCWYHMHFCRVTQATYVPAAARPEPPAVRPPPN